jgi:hypothetical protein
MLGGMVVGQIPAARGQDLGDILVGGGIAILVNQFGGQIDRFVNQVTGNKPNGTTETTRVVPIVTIGRGAYVGAVQVSGPKAQVDKVKAVAQVEGQTKIGRQIRVKGLIPVDTTKPGDLTSISRIKGVGVSAIIDIRL